MITITLPEAVIFFPDDEITEAKEITRAGRPAIAFKAAGTGGLQFIKTYSTPQERDRALLAVREAQKLQERLKETEKELEKMREESLKKTSEKKKTTRKKEKTEKKEEPKKTKEELREERIKQMRERAKVVDKTTIVKEPTKPQPNGRTDKKTLTDAEIAKLLNQGYKPGKSTNLASNAEQLAYSLIKEAFERKWDVPPWTDTLKPMTIRVWFGGGGRIVAHKIEKSSGDIRADQSLKAAAERVGAIPALAPEFIEKYRKNGVPVQFTVKPH